MARIIGASNEKVYRIPKWLGLNEHPDGDTKLKLGEASKMVNWKITRDGNLKRRPGTKFIVGLADNYDIEIDDDLTYIGTYGPNNGFVLYDIVETSNVPGGIHLAPYSGDIEDGVLSGVVDATVEHATLKVPAESRYRVMAGVLLRGKRSVWMKNMGDALGELGEGEYYYIHKDEGYYAINSDCLEINDNDYVLSGYLIKALGTEGNPPVVGMWTGLCYGKEVFLAACNGYIWSLYDATNDKFICEKVGTIDTDGPVSFFPFNNRVYILNGKEYYFFDGEGVELVSGYIPVIVKNLGPDGGDQTGWITGEYVNLLTNYRRVWLSPDGTNDAFTMPETVNEFGSVYDLVTGDELVEGTDYTVSDNTITFTTTPDEGENTIEVYYKADTGNTNYRTQVTKNMFAELYSGATDTAVFLYGDGTNRTIYSGMNEDGLPDAEYFPDQYSVDVGDSNTPITGLIRHHGALLAFKTDSAWALTYNTTQLADGNSTIAIYCTTLNKDKGSIVPGQVQLVNNNPITCSGTELYQWRSVSRYSSVIGRDERNANRISDRVQSSVKELSIPNVCMWDDDDNQELYIVGNKIALIWNYAVDAWYRYETLDAVCMCSFHGEVYTGTSDGRVRVITDDAMTDEGFPIHAKWVSGAMDFGEGYMRKYSSMLWVGLKPLEGTSVDVCLETDRKNTFKEKVVSSSKAKVAGQPFMVKTKLKAKKFVYYRLIFTVDEKMPAVTVTDVDIRVRSTGYTK